MNNSLRTVGSIAAMLLSIAIFYSAYVQWNTSRVHKQVERAILKNRPTPHSRAHETKQNFGKLLAELRSIEASAANSKYQRNLKLLQDRLELFIYEIQSLPDEKSSTIELLSFSLSQIIQGERSQFKNNIRKAISDLEVAMLELQESRYAFW